MDQNRRVKSHNYSKDCTCSRCRRRTMRAETKPWEAKRKKKK